MWTGGQVPLHAVNVTWADFDLLAFIFHLFNHFCFVSWLVCRHSSASTLTVACMISCLLFNDLTQAEVIFQHLVLVFVSFFGGGLENF
jgi:hypothetical protein